MKNAFYFTLKARFVLKIYIFLSSLFSHAEKMAWLERKAFYDVMIYDVTTWLTNNCNTHIILPIISRSKDNQSMKFGQLIEYGMRKNVNEKLYTKFGEETIPRPFSKKSKLSVFLNQESKVFCSLFLLYARLRVIEIYWK